VSAPRTVVACPTAMLMFTHILIKGTDDAAVWVPELAI
jgi:hypothetical protein